MSEKPNTEAVNIRILDRSYTVGVKPEERTSLIAAARLLEDRMQELRGDNRVAPVERVAVLAALNLAHELHLLREESRSREQQLAQLLERLETRLALLSSS